VGSEYTLAATDQRHRAVVNGIWEVGWGLQASASTSTGPACGRA